MSRNVDPAAAWVVDAVRERLIARRLGNIPPGPEKKKFGEITILVALANAFDNPGQGARLVIIETNLTMDDLIVQQALDIVQPEARPVAVVTESTLLCIYLD